MDDVEPGIDEVNICKYHLYSSILSWKHLDFR